MMTIRAPPGKFFMIPTSQLTVEEETELSETIEEIRINCTAGMLLCLDREQRLIYILGEMFDIDHNFGSEIMGISAGNFRIRLMRAREDIYNWINKRCGLVNKNNPCRCAKKTKGFIKAGIVNPADLKFNTRYKQRIFDLSSHIAADVTDSFEDLNKKIFQSHPFQEQLTPNRIMEEILGNKLIQFVLKS